MGKPVGRSWKPKGCFKHCVIWAPGGDGIILRVCAHCPAQFGKHYEEDAERKDKMARGSREGHSKMCDLPIR